MGVFEEHRARRNAPQPEYYPTEWRCEPMADGTLWYGKRYVHTRSERSVLPGDEEKKEGQS